MDDELNANTMQTFVLAIDRARNLRVLSSESIISKALKILKVKASIARSSRKLNFPKTFISRNINSVLRFDPSHFRSTPLTSSLTCSPHHLTGYITSRLLYHISPLPSVSPPLTYPQCPIPIPTPIPLPSDPKPPEMPPPCPFCSIAAALPPL